MKKLIALALLTFSSLTFAIPYTCTSVEEVDGTPLMKFKINKKRPVEQNGSTWNLYLIGVTPNEGFRKILYASGNADSNGIGMTFVKDGWVLGSATARAVGNELFEGEAKISGVAQNKTLEIRCFKSP